MRWLSAPMAPWGASPDRSANQRRSTCSIAPAPHRPARCGAPLGLFGRWPPPCRCPGGGPTASASMASPPRGPGPSWLPIAITGPRATAWSLMPPVACSPPATTVSCGSTAPAPAGSLKPLRRRAAPGGKDPFSARFSHDGRRIAVGFEDNPAVAVLDGASLEPLPAADTSSIANGNLITVALECRRPGACSPLAATAQTTAAIPWWCGPLAEGRLSACPWA
jgi:hypothetical protein